MYMDKVTAPWWVSIWPTFNIILIIVIWGISIFFLVKLLKFLNLGIIVFKDYLEKNKK